MRAVRTVSLAWLVAASLVVSAGVQAQAQVTDEGTREQLAALKKLCDEGVVSPDVCKEKQRELLGLTPKISGSAARGSAPSPRGGTRAAPSAQDSSGPVRPEQEATERSRSAAPSENAETLAERVHEGPLGFRMRLSARWRRASPQETQKGFALVKNQLEDNPEAKRAWERVSNNVEIYIRDGEHLGIQARDGAVPQNAADGATVCQQLSSIAAKVTSRPLATHECGLRTGAGATVFYVEQDGVAKGRRTMQVWLERSPTKVLQFTLNLKNENVEARRKELTDIVASVRWQ